MNNNEFMDRLDLQSSAVAIAIIVVALALILFLNRRALSLRWREWRNQRSLDRIGSEQLRNLVCPDGLDGYFVIDRIALLQDAIVVIAYRPYGGHIFCAERISEWTQVLGQKSFKFENPLFDLANQLASLRLQIGNLPIFAYLFFDSSAEFPKGRPENVLRAGEIPAAMLGDNLATASPDIQAAWEQLKRLHQENSHERSIGLKT